MKRLLLPLLAALALPIAVNAEHPEPAQTIQNIPDDDLSDEDLLPNIFKEKEESLISKPTEEIE